jgi:adenylate cyclase
MKRKWISGLLLGLGGAALALTMWFGDLPRGMDNYPWLWRVRALAQPSPATDQIKLIMLDQNSLDWGKNENSWSWPWPREVYGVLLDFCKRAGARTVAFDVLFTEPSVYGVNDDQALGDAIRRSPPFAGAVYLSSKQGEFTNWPGAVPVKLPIFQGLEKGTTGFSKDWKSAARASFPIAAVATNATLLANVNDLPDFDGVFRRATLVREFDGRVLPSLGLGAYLAAHPKTQLALAPGWLTVDGKAIPLDEHGRATLRFVGPSRTHQEFSAKDVIRSELLLREGQPPVVQPAVLRDCYVFFGYSAPGLLDLRPTPVSKVYPGVEIHATALDNLLTRMFLRDLPAAATALVTLLLALVAGLAGRYSRNSWQTVLGFVVLLPLTFALGFAGYFAGWWWPIAPGFIAVALTLIGAVVVNYATEGRQKAFLKSAFKHYLGPDVIEQIIADPSRLQLGGEKRTLTLFFSDIEKFSGFSEKLDPPTLTKLLNDYLTEMGACITAEGGYLDKYIGDAIVAFWNAPLGQDDHAARACRAALRCQQRLAELRPQFQESTGAVVKNRIGLNTGEVTVGNMGSYERFNYTILGDAANLASRLEGANKAFGTYLMVSEATWQQSGGNFVGRELARLRVVGRKTAVRVYELAGLPGTERPAHFAAFEAALAQFYAGDFAAALAAFEKLPDDPASRAYAAQCHDLLAHPPAAWDGVWSLTEK